MPSRQSRLVPIYVVQPIHVWREPCTADDVLKLIRLTLALGQHAYLSGQVLDLAR